MSGFLLRRIVTELPRYGYRFSSEAELHRGIADVLEVADIQFGREVVVSAHDRLDFLCDGGIAIEVKIKGSFAQAVAQCARYAQLPQVGAVVLATTRHWTGSPAAAGVSEINGKPFRMIRLGAQSF